MNLEFVGRNFEIDDRVRSFTEAKLGKKLIRLVQEPVETRVTLETEKHRDIADLHVSHRGGVLQATEETTGMYEASARPWTSSRSRSGDTSARTRTTA